VWGTYTEPARICSPSSSGTFGPFTRTARKGTLGVD
jgi:hypothetical protein